MLVLTRKPAQSIAIGDKIKITVLRVDGKQVSIGIEAPRDIQIVRDDAVSVEQKHLLHSGGE